MVVGVAICLVVGLATAPFLRAQDSVRVSIGAPPELHQGSDFVATVNIDEVTSFDAANYDITYDPTVLEVTDVTDGAIGGTAIPVDMWSVVATGRLRVINNVAGLGMASGSGYLAEIHFHVLGSAGTSSNIELSNGALSNSDANEIEAAWIGYSVQVHAATPTGSATSTPGQTSTPSPTPTYAQDGGGDGGYTPSPTSVPTPTPSASTSPGPTQTAETTVSIHLEAGWNLFSFGVIPASSDVEAVFASVEGMYDVVEGFDGTTLSYHPGLSLEGNTLTVLDPYHGYWIKMREAATLIITGVPVVSSVPLPLSEGWNLVSYLGDGALPVGTALFSIDGLYTAVLSYDGQAQSFYPSLPADMNTLQSLRPGYGYWIKMSATATLIYPNGD